MRDRWTRMARNTAQFGTTTIEERQRREICMKKEMTAGREE
jgi:hypothetical protein